jgi:hypothetical protein
VANPLRSRTRATARLRLLCRELPEPWANTTMPTGWAGTARSPTSSPPWDSMITGTATGLASTPALQSGLLRGYPVIVDRQHDRIRRSPSAGGTQRWDLRCGCVVAHGRGHPRDMGFQVAGVRKSLQGWGPRTVERGEKVHPATTPTSPEPSYRSVPRSAARAATNASATPPGMSTAESAPKCAAAANRRAKS